MPLKPQENGKWGREIITPQITKLFMSNSCLQRALKIFRANALIRANEFVSSNFNPGQARPLNCPAFYSSGNINWTQWGPQAHLSFSWKSTVGFGSHLSQSWGRSFARSFALSALIYRSFALVSLCI